MGGIKISEVFFVPGVRSEPVAKLDAIAEALYNSINPKHEIADTAMLKVHVGEIGNDGTEIHTHMRPDWVKPFANLVRRDGATRIFAADSIPTYVFGKRSTLAGHQGVAKRHGFTPANIGVEFIVAAESGRIEIPNTHGGGLHRIYMPKLFHDVAVNAGYAIVLSHFKGHEIYTFGGALKNLGMGFVGKETKAAIHHFKAIVDYEKCQGCLTCIDFCTHNAITKIAHPREAETSAAQVNQDSCYGCMGCLRACDYGAIGLNFGALGNIDTPEGKDKIGRYVTDSLIVAAKGVTNVFQPGHMLFVTDLTEITVFCDCDSPVLHDLKQSEGHLLLANDIGYLASTDPVALDQACIDLVQRETPEKKWHELCQVRPSYFPVALKQQIAKAVELKIGTDKYELITLKV